MRNSSSVHSSAQKMHRAIEQVRRWLPRARDAQRTRLAHTIDGEAGTSGFVTRALDAAYDARGWLQLAALALFAVMVIGVGALAVHVLGGGGARSTIGARVAGVLPDNPIRVRATATATKPAKTSVAGSPAGAPTIVGGAPIGAASTITPRRVVAGAALNPFAPVSAAAWVSTPPLPFVEGGEPRDAAAPTAASGVPPPASSGNPASTASNTSIAHGIASATGAPATATTGAGTVVAANTPVPGTSPLPPAPTDTAAPLPSDTPTETPAPPLPPAPTETPLPPTPVLVDPPATPLPGRSGDVTGDGLVNCDDVSAITSHFSVDGVADLVENLDRYDLNGDGRINHKDAAIARSQAQADVRCRQ